MDDDLRFRHVRLGLSVHKTRGIIGISRSYIERGIPYWLHAVDIDEEFVHTEWVELYWVEEREGRTPYPMLPALRDSLRYTGNLHVKLLANSNTEVMIRAPGLFNIRCVKRVLFSSLIVAMQSWGTMNSGEITILPPNLPILKAMRISFIRSNHTRVVDQVPLTNPQVPISDPPGYTLGRTISFGLTEDQMRYLERENAVTDDMLDALDLLARSIWTKRKYFSVVTLKEARRKMAHKRKAEEVLPQEIPAGDE